MASPPAVVRIFTTQKSEDDLRDLRRDRRGKETTDQRKLGVPLAQIPRLDHSLHDNRARWKSISPEDQFSAIRLILEVDTRGAKMVLPGVVPARGTTVR